MTEFEDAVLKLNSTEQYVQLLAHMVLCPDVAKFALDKVSPDDFGPDTIYTFGAVWISAQAYWSLYSSPPPQGYMHATVRGILSGSQMAYDNIVQHNDSIIQQLYIIESQGLNPDYGKRLLNQLLDQMFSRKMSALPAGDSKTRDELFEELQHYRNDLSVSDFKIVSAFDVKNSPPNLLPRMRTGCQLFDELLGGGVAPTEVYGLLGPTGGGKTVLAGQIASQMALNGQYVQYWTYELPAEQMQARILGSAARVNNELYKDKSWRDFPPEVRERMIEASEKRGDNLDIIDRSTAGSSVAEIEQAVQQFSAKGRKPKLVIIDWIYLLALRVMMSKSRGRQQDRGIFQSMLEDIKQMAARHSTSFLLVHQLSTEIAKKKSGAKPQWFNSAEAGSFAWLLHYCVAIGTATATGKCWVVGSKARGAGKQEVLARLNGKFNRFEYDPADKGKDFVFDGDDLVPTNSVGRISPKKSDDEADEPPEPSAEEENFINPEDGVSF
jgi:KaiC/GvpD/RAD55 family RecA-like ATPase